LTRRRWNGQYVRDIDPKMIDKFMVDFRDNTVDKRPKFSCTNFSYAYIEFHNHFTNFVGKTFFKWRSNFEVNDFETIKTRIEIRNDRVSYAAFCFNCRKKLYTYTQFSLCTVPYTTLYHYSQILNIITTHYLYNVIKPRMPENVFWRFLARWKKNN